MCGRYAITLPPEAIRAWFGYGERPNFPPRFNVAPTQPIPIVTRDPERPGSKDRYFRLVRWGFLPGFVKDVASFPLLINARVEGLEEKPSFRAALIRRRCLVIADGYYEWRRPASGRTGAPFLIRHPEGAPLGFAGLWESWMGADGSEIDTACIITTASTGLLAGIHPRRPAVVARADYEAWLDCADVTPAMAVRLLDREPDLGAVEIGPAVNKVANDDPAIQRPAEPLRSPDQPRQGTLF